MSDIATKRMLEAYIEKAPASSFFTRMFTPKFYTSKTVEVDISRSNEDVAIVIDNIATGPRMNSADLYTNKEFEAPIYIEAVPLNVFDLLNRQAGENPFADVNFQASATARMLDGMTKVEAKIRRAVELQASQVMQTATVDLIDSNGVSRYTIDYSPKATHFPNAAIAWGTGTEDKMQDILDVADVIRADGKVKADMLVFGSEAFQSFIKDEDVRALLDNRRIAIGGIAPVSRGDEATFQGTITIGDYFFEMWTLPSRYTDPQTGVSTPFMDPAKVVVKASQSRMDGTFGAIPLVVPPDQRLLPFLPGRISNQAGGVDLFPNAWVSNDGTNIFASLASRPLMIPVAIDTFGCLDTGL